MYLFAFNFLFDLKKLVSYKQDLIDCLIHVFGNLTFYNLNDQKHEFFWYNFVVVYFQNTIFVVLFLSVNLYYLTYFVELQSSRKPFYSYFTFFFNTFISFSISLLAAANSIAIWKVGQISNFF